MPKNKGFTLIETLLFLAIAAFLLVALSSFFAFTLSARAKNSTVLAVESTGLRALNLISQSIRDAQNFAIQGGDLILDTATFQLAGSNLQIVQNGVATNLNPQNVIVSNLNFTDFAPKLVQVSFELDFANPENRKEFSYSQKFQTAAALRNY